uniref:Ectonucleoside triphosphate diphosphohydrolase 2b n=1 Tax=Denticeps clupeoides TaxID=299321 RepID=A0AAY4CB98_9TELE
MGKMNSLLVSQVALLLFGIVAIVLLTIPILDVSEPPGNMYGIVLDAGSSHTAMFIYKWPADKQNGTGVVTQHSECHVKGGGISSYAGQPGGAGRSLEECLNQAVQDIPKSRHQQTPVYLGATAGMRLLNMSNSAQCTQVLEEVGVKIRSYPFNFKGAAILSGQEEGAYGWVTVNYLLENFIKYGFIGRWLSSGKQTVGALDFGGASTQITFVTTEPVEDAQDGMTLRLYSQDYSLYTHSFLCYGRDQMLYKLLAHLVKTQNYPAVVSHPCYPADYKINLTQEYVFDSPCTASLRPTTYTSQAKFTVVGSGNYNFCLGNMSEIFSLKSCRFSKCSFNGVFQPKVTGNFIAFSAFFYTYSFLQQVTGITVATPSEMEQGAKAVCSMTFQQMLAKAPDQKSRLQDYCAVSVFIKELLQTAYGFDNQTFPQISFQKKAGDTSIGWALGYMLSLSSLVPAESVSLRKAIQPGAWVLLLFIISLLLIITLDRN